MDTARFQFLPILIEKRDSKGPCQPGAAVGGGASAETLDDLFNSMFQGVTDQLARSKGGRVQGIPLLRF